jgi:prepilin-type N-terminal cleavage/methylation domain-containing protein
MNQRGFSLIELLLVVIIILVLAALAIPNFMRARMRANEGSAVGSLRQINTAAVTYFTSYANGYPPNLATLGPPAAFATCDAADLLDGVLGQDPANKSGYTMAFAPGLPNAIAPVGCANPGSNAYAINADPTAPGTTGDRFFFTDQAGVIRFSTAGPATAADPPIA